MREVTGRAQTAARVAVQTGILRGVNARGLAQAARLLRQKAGGPSAILRFHGANTPERCAMLFGSRALSYGEVDSRVDRLATGLRRRGLGRGDAALIVTRNRPEFLEIQAAMGRLGGAGVSGSYRSTPAELEYLATHCGAKAVFFEHDIWPAVRAAHAKIPELPRERLFPVGGDVEGLTRAEDLLAALPDADLEESEGTVVIYTSGTTGKPKGAVRKFSTSQIHGFLAFVERTPFRTDDRHLCVCPLYHSTGFGFAGITMMLGGTVVLAREFDPEDFLATIEREKITTTAIVPTMLYRLMALPDEVFRRYRLDSLRAVVCGGAQLPGSLSDRALDRLGPVLYNFYGATETGLVTLADPEDLRAAPGTIGRALRGNEVRLLDEAGREVPAGEVGELYVRNAMLVAGYHRDEAATRESMRDGFFSVGDLAKVDAHGRYEIVGRRRDMVISGGVNVYPAEVEAAIESHPGVAQCAVIGVEDPEWGERLRAFVVRRAGAGLGPAELRAFCKERLSGAKVPREFAFLDALPANPTGKVLKRELRDWRGEVERV